MTVKNIYLLIITLILILSCSEDEKVEIIDTYNDQYIHLNEDMIDPFANASMNTLWQDLKPIKEILSDMDDDMTFSYRLYIGTAGNVDKILVLLSKSEEVDKYIFESVNDWQLKSYKNNDYPAKYSFDFNFKYMKDENSKYWIVPVNNIRSDSESDEIVYMKVDEMPFPVGGLKSIMEKITYPEEAKRDKIEGRVFIKAVINNEGYVISTELIKGIGGGCNEAALQAVRETLFTPGRKNGVPVTVEITVPILFRLQ